jgi:hypothetical protein
MKNLNSKIEGSTQMPEYEWPLSKWIIANLPFKEYVYNARLMHKKIVSLKMEKNVDLKCAESCPEQEKGSI